MAIMPWMILGLVAALLGARPSATLRPYCEFVVVVLVFPTIVYGLMLEMLALARNTR